MIYALVFLLLAYALPAIGTYFLIRRYYRRRPYSPGAFDIFAVLCPMLNISAFGAHIILWADDVDLSAAKFFRIKK